MEKSSRSHPLIEASSLMREIAQPEKGGKHALRKVKSKLPAWSWRHVKSVFYAEEGTRIDAKEMDELRHAAKINPSQKMDENDADDLRRRIEKLENILLAMLQENDLENMEQLRVRIYRLRNLDAGAG